MRLIVVRHGQTSCNRENIWHGWDNCELTEVGLAQARAVGERLAAEPIQAVYSSDSQRAFQTASAIGAHHDITPIADAGLRERYSGDFEGIAVGDILARYPGLLEERAADYWGWRPPGGETFREVLDRTLRVIHGLQERHQDETVVVATHMGPVRVLMTEFAGVPIADTYAATLPSTGVSIFHLNGRDVEVEVLNDDSHVPSVA